MPQSRREAAEGPCPVKFDEFSDIRSTQGAISEVRVCAMWLLGGFLNEIEYRSEKDRGVTDATNDSEPTVSGQKNLDYCRRNGGTTDART